MTQRQFCFWRSAGSSDGSIKHPTTQKQVSLTSHISEIKTYYNYNVLRQNRAPRSPQIMLARLFIIYYFVRSIGVTDGYYICPSIDASRSLHRIPEKVQMAVDSENEIGQSIELQNGDDPCWQNMLDDDCSMGNIYAANFVASKWIQSMPCGEGIEV